MSQRIEKSWVVLASIENGQHNYCVDVFRRPDASYGFEAFRRDPEDGGAWTAIAYFSAATFASPMATIAAAQDAVPWLRDVAIPAFGAAQ